MPEIKIQHIQSFSTEDKNFPAQNLLSGDSFKKWKCAKGGEKNVVVTLQLTKAEQIHEVHIGNEGSAFIEVLVGRSSMKEDEYKVLVVTSSFMSPVESRNGQNTTRVRLFSSDKLVSSLKDEKWDRIKVVCTQPFNRTAQYGLSFIKLHSPPETKTEASQHSTVETLGAFSLKPEASEIKAGSLFANRNKEKKDPAPLTGAAAIRAASHSVEQSLTTRHPTAIKRKLSDESNGSVKKQATSMATTSKHSPQSARNDSPTPGASGIATKTNKPNPGNGRADKKSDKPSNGKPGMSRNGTKTDKPSVEGRKRSREAKTSLDRLMRRVVFAISGYQNPERGEIRDRALNMGAKYRPDWTKDCTHLVCAYANTPKYNQVKGKGRIVKAAWVKDCYKHQELRPWRDYSVGRPGSSFAVGFSSGSEDEEETVLTPSVKPNTHQASPSPEASPTLQQSYPTQPQSGDVYDGSTDQDTSDTEDESKGTIDSKPQKLAAASVYDVTTDDESNTDDAPSDHAPSDHAPSDIDLPELPDFFTNKAFFLYGDYKANLRRSLTRYIIAYNGSVQDYMSGDTSYVVTCEDWDDKFDSALEDNPHVVFVTPDWVFACDQQQKLVPHHKFLVTQR